MQVSHVIRHLCPHQETEAASVQKDIHEGDRVYVGFKEDKISLFSPEGREL